MLILYKNDRNVRFVLFTKTLIGEKLERIIFFLAAALATHSQWEVTDCTERNGYACKGPESMNLLPVIEILPFEDKF